MSVLGSGLVLTILLQLRGLLKGIVDKTENKIDDKLLELLDEADFAKIAKLVEDEAKKLLDKKKEDK
jgi:hypothetical protein